MVPRPLTGVHMEVALHPLAGRNDLGNPGIAVTARPVTATHSLDGHPERIGPYRVVDVIGEGGMGVVYEAEQERPRRKVALKVLKSLPGAKGLSRFEHEAELLARNAFSIRYALIHDMVHVLTGFDASWVGEVGVLAFVGGQNYLSEVVGQRQRRGRCDQG